MGGWGVEIITGQLGHQTFQASLPRCCAEADLFPSSATLHVLALFVSHAVHHSSSALETRTEN